MPSYGFSDVAAGAGSVVSAFAPVGWFVGGLLLATLLLGYVLRLLLGASGSSRSVRSPGGGAPSASVSGRSRSNPFHASGVRGAAAEIVGVGRAAVDGAQRRAEAARPVEYEDIFDDNGNFVAVRRV